MTTLYPDDVDTWQDPVGGQALLTSPDGRTHPQHHTDLQHVVLDVESQLVGPVFTSSAGYNDTAAVLLVGAEALSDGTGGPWTATNPNAGDIPSLDTVNFTQGASSVTCDIKFPPGIGTSLFYFDLTTPVAVGSHTAMTMDLRFEVGNGSGSELGFEVVAATGAALTGTVATSPNTHDDNSADLWFTITVPLGALATVKSVGIRKMASASGSSSKWVRWWIDNVQLREATAVDSALKAVTGAVIVPSDYVPSEEQFTDSYSSVRSVLDLRPAHANLAGIGGVYNLRDWRLDETGTNDVTEDLQRIVDSLPDGTTLRAPSSAIFRIDNTVTIGTGKRNITFDGQGSRWFQPTEANSALFKLFGTENTFRGVRGFSLNNSTGTVENWGSGDGTHPIVGTPTVVGTTVKLDALNEQVEVPWKDDNCPAYWARDHLGINRWDFVLSDSNHVASDCKFTVMTPNGTVLQTTTVTLTGTPTTYQVTYTPTDLYTSLRVAISKATATANTITLASATQYGRQRYDANLAFNHLLTGGSTSTNCRMIDCWAEGMGGDAVTTNGATGFLVDGLGVRVVGRQGVSFNSGHHITMRNSEIIAASRHSIDMEPETNNVWVTDVRFDNCTFIDPGLGGIAWTGWPRVRKIHMRNCDFISTGPGHGAMSTGGCWEGTLENCSFIEQRSSPPDVEFTGRAMSINNCTASAGVTLNASNAVKQDENGFFPVGDYISVNNWRAYRPVGAVLTSNITNYSSTNNISLGGSYAEQYP